MAGVMERTLGILELLAKEAEGLPLAAIAERLGMPKSAAHRLLHDLMRYGYVRQAKEQGDYLLTTRLTSLGLGFLSASGIVDAAQPLLDRLAHSSGELVRLSVVDGNSLTWVAKAQGARGGLRYDPDMGAVARLSCSASGLAWLSTLSDEQALGLVEEQGFGQSEDYGPNAVTTAQGLLEALALTRQQGIAMVMETFAPGMHAMAAPILRSGHCASGVISIAGPGFRLTQEHMHSLREPLLDVAEELAASTAASGMLRRAHY
ncbi:IclR family transcriptional regulator [Halomonas denitrificans]|uniref:IclR family transcriptional regulator n=1 Tax=Halomonas denitrificans TaxID=370769 RepID=UPI001CD67F6E|nr:IclR family transcriptional regulator [Halomonas denitrificans]MCA0975822.1 IclR family transcriptional regulator [Halomonas denitrificans]